MKHQSDRRVLDRRTLEYDHRALARLLRPGIRVLDVGCGTGAITAGIAQAVGPPGLAVGVDRDANLLASAVRRARVVQADAVALPFDSAFDVATAARTLEWIADPARAVASMARATRSGGLVLVLDYSHEHAEWRPDPPLAFVRFYRAFLDWRDSNGWDNSLAEHLPKLFTAAGLRDVRSYDENENAIRGDIDFETRVALWAHVIETVGPTMAAGGFGRSAELDEAKTAYLAWAESELRTHTLYLRAVVGRKP